MAKNSLAAFRIDPKAWEDFKSFSDDRGTSASALLTRFISQCLETGLVPGTLAPAPAPMGGDNRLRLIESRVGALEKSFEGDDIQFQLDSLNRKIEALESKIEKISANEESQGEEKSEGMPGNLEGVAPEPSVVKTLDKIFKGAGSIPASQWEKLAPKQLSQRVKLAPYVHFTDTTMVVRLV